MAQLGYLSDKHIMKLYILYILSRIPQPLDFAALIEVCMTGEGVDYFLLSQAVDELVQADHLKLDLGVYTVTDNGRKNGAILEEELPPSLRQKCDEILTGFNALLRERAHICASISPAEKGYTVHLAIKDPQGELLHLSLYSPTQEQARKQALTFRKNADAIYKTILQSLGATPHNS